MQENIQGDNFKTSDGCTIAYTLGASRHPLSQRLVLIHSLALDSSFWDSVVARLADQFEILAYDCRGHGHSERHAANFTMELFARDLAELLDHVGWQTAALAGCSMGGCVAQAFAGLYPLRAKALTLIDTTAWYGSEAPQKWRERATAAQSKGLGGIIDFQVERWFSSHFRASHPESVNATIAVFLANDVSCFSASCDMLGTADLRPYLESFQIPVAVIVGEEDYATPVSSARHLRDSIRGATLTILPGARHLTPIEVPEQIASEIGGLMRQI